MAAFCLLPKYVDAFKKGLVNGEIDPKKLSSLSSAERRATLEQYVGKDNAQEVNALFESKLLLKNQKAGYISWAKKVSGLTTPAKRDLISKIERLQNVLDPKAEEQFLNDLASTRLKVNVTQDEAKVIADYSKKITETKAKANESGVFPTQKDRLSYGASVVDLENYMNGLKLDAKKISFFEHPIKATTKAIGEIPGTMKSVVASLDNSFWGRQGIKTVLDLRTSNIWAKNFLKSWVDIPKQIFAKGNPFKSGDDVVINSIKADIYSRPNAINGKYKAGGYGLDILSEEAFPSSLPEKIPILGRLFKASEAAYNGAALRLRADLADRLIRIAEKNGVNTLDPKEAKAMGDLIGSLTGRGSLQLTPGQSKFANATAFSVKFLKSNFDTLTAQQFNGRATAFTKSEARKNLLNIVATLTGIMTVAKIIDPNSVDEDPRGTNFGKVKILGHWTDITGGMASLLTLSARLAPSYHDGKLSWWIKNKNGQYTETGIGGYGKTTPLDIFENFFEGKLSPIAGILRDVWSRQTYSGEPVTFNTELKNQTPLSIQSFDKLFNDPKSSFALGSMILEGLGFSTDTNSYKKSWDLNPSKTLQQFKSKVGDQKFKEANDKFNQQYNAWFNKINNSGSYKKLSDEEKSALQEKAKASIQDKIFKQYGFKYKAPKKTPGQKNESKTIKTLIPK